jgi:hypothetical protein
MTKNDAKKIEKLLQKAKKTSREIRQVIDKKKRKEK